MARAARAGRYSAVMRMSTSLPTALLFLFAFASCAPAAEGTPSSTAPHGEADGQTQNDFSDFLEAAIQRAPDSIVDYRWDAIARRGEIKVKDDAVEIMERLAAESRVAVEVVRATEEALPYDQRSTVELAVLKALQDLGAAGLGAAYTPDTNSVRVTAWTNDPASIRQRVDELNAKGDGPRITVEFEPADQAPRPMGAEE
ncbi:MAG: hypothetical protein IPJ61_09910 [Tessaracoccus sp.]|uniref:hypothetical protein n=1 Tax=Tessaracoccus sp. TaxID=1971211 RepID=UPI001EC02B19|nr:hypothetical protein [Tessaracoccus sp.]MBK7821370.1 hypothetical protein [Tessaracoccus sp.]